MKPFISKQCTPGPRPGFVPGLLLWWFVVASAIAQTNTPAAVQTNAPVALTNLPPWLTHPLSLADALNVALEQNGVILKAKNDLEASYGVVVQTRAITL